MIIARIRGGLGNQLFQYAAAKALAVYYGTKLKLDLYYFSKHPYRTFDLSKFNFPIEIAHRKEVHQFTGKNPVVRYLNKRENYLRCNQVAVQPHYHYFEDFFKLPSNIYLSGYWQSEKYFLSIQDQIRQWFVLNEKLDSKNEELIAEMLTNQSISIHVRRGDYTSQNFSPFFGGLTKAYYQRAVEKMLADMNNPKFFIFSDDIAWCKTNLMIPNAVYVDHNRGSSSYKDLFLMSRSKHNIIANSSFSWWGAWLNQNPQKKVIAPMRWFRKEYYDARDVVYPSRIYNDKDLIPYQWIRIDAGE